MPRCGIERRAGELFMGLLPGADATTRPDAGELFTARRLIR
eukprot:COSAG01_NODE_5202_length_4414_cov_32.900116_4_plen_41_part_00